MKGQSKKTAKSKSFETANEDADFFDEKNSSQSKDKNSSEIAGDFDETTNQQTINSELNKAEENKTEENKEEKGEQEFDLNDVSDESQKEKFNQANSQTERESIDELGVPEEIINQKMKDVLSQNTPKQKRKSTILYIILMIINIVLVVFIVKGLLSSLEGTSISSILKSRGKNLWWLFGAFLMYIFFVFIQMVSYRVLIKNLSGKKSWKIPYELAVVGKYYDNVTPFAMGGQGVQIVRLAENGIGAGVSTSIPVLKLIINSGVNSVLALLFFCVGMPLIPKVSLLNDFLVLLLEILGVIGLIITSLIALFIFFISSGTVVTKSLVSGFLRFGYKLHIVKDYRATYKKVMNQVAEYKFAMSYLKKHKKILFELILTTVLEWLSYASFALFVVLAFAESFDTALPLFVFLCFAKYYICSMASCYIPLPGGTGLMEISFVLLFGVILGNNVVLALLCWRFFTYYIIIIHGFSHECIRIMSTLIRSKGKKKQIQAKNN